jgi:hypothetical protein
VDGALKFVKPEGLNHTIEGGTNGAGLDWRARCQSLSGIEIAFSESGREAGEDLDSLCSSELSEKRVHPDPDAPEEALVAAPTAIALGPGSVGKSCVLGSSCSQSPSRETIVSGKGMILKCWGTNGEQFSWMSLVTASSSNAKSRDSTSATVFSLPGNHCV